MLHLKFSTQLALPEQQLRRGRNQQGHRCPGRELARSATGRWRRRPEVGKEEGGVRRSSNWGSVICSFQCPLPRSTDQIAGFRKRMQMTSAKTKGENEIKIGEKNVCTQGDSSHLGLVLRSPPPLQSHRCLLRLPLQTRMDPKNQKWRGGCETREKP